jgi:acyl-CoA hydrolase
MTTRYERNADAAVDHILEVLGRRIVVGTPLGIGKPNALLNALYRRAKNDSSIRLDLVTALSLNPPQGASELEERFLKPIRERVWGDYPRLEFLEDVEAGSVPANIRVIEFYVKSGSRLGNPVGQQNYISSNYTHVARDMILRGVNLVMQSLALREEDGDRRYSLSSNPDVSLDMLPLLAQQPYPCLRVGQVNRSMPWMGNDAEVPESNFDLILDQPSLDHAPFSVPHQPVGPLDWAIGLHAASLVRDGGTLQVGIGALGDACCHALRLRGKDAQSFSDAVDAVGGSALIETIGGRGGFDQGLYVASELVSNPLYALFEDGIVRRRVYDDEHLQDWIDRGLVGEQAMTDLFEVLHRDAGLRRIGNRTLEAMQRYGLAHPGLRREGQRLRLPDGRLIDNDLDQAEVRGALDAQARGPGLRGGVAMHGAFFIGPADFYARLSALPDDARSRIGMTSVSEVNRIYTNYRLEQLQRRHPRFINITMKVSLLGAAVSDQVADGQIISGVGGQYNFVSMAHQLPEGRSILCLRATRGSGAGLESNLVWEYPHATIPRHLRDIVITEYGVADLRGRTDRECIEALLAIADSRCQRELISKAQSAGKLPADYALPASARNNLPGRISSALQPFMADNRLPKLPFGCDLTDQELALAGKLQQLKAATGSWSGRMRLVRALLRPAPEEREDVAFALRHLELDEASAPRLLRRLVRAAMV